MALRLRDHQGGRRRNRGRSHRTVTVIVALIVGVALGGCEVTGRLDAARLRSMSDEEVAAYLERNPESDEAEYAEWILSPEAGLNPPTGVTPRNVLIFAHEECAGSSPAPPAEWRRERLGEPVGFENFAHTARGFAHRMVCPDEP